MSDFTFSTLEYQRPDFAAVGSFAEQMAERMKQAGSYEELKALMKENEEASKEFSNDVCDRLHSQYLRHER